MAGWVAVITGGASGIGLEYARALVVEGVSVALVDLDRARAERAAASLARDYDVRAIGVAADVTDPEAVRSAAEQITAVLGRTDVLINNAGLHLPEWTKAPTELDHVHWRRLLDVNVIGIVNCVRAFRPLLRDAPHGVVLNQGSVAGHQPLSSYGITKLAVRGLTVALAAELAEDGIRVVSLAPGAVSTPAVLASVPGDRLRDLVSRQLIGRLADIDDLIAPMLFLCSAQAGFVTGETLAVSGGYPTCL